MLDIHAASFESNLASIILLVGTNIFWALEGQTSPG
jgi:hypothetical protein